MIRFWSLVFSILLFATFAIADNSKVFEFTDTELNELKVRKVRGADNKTVYSVGSNENGNYLKAIADNAASGLGKELADKNIAVNAVTPAGAKTRILDQMSKEHVQRMLSKVPRGRFLEIHEFTALVCWLCSEENSFSTAAVFDISGGRSTY